MGSEGDLLPIGTFVYGSMVVLVAAYLHVREGGDLLHVLCRPERLRRDLVLGLGVGLIVPAINRAFVRAWEVFRYVEEELGRWIGPLSAPAAARLAILSGVGEELLFRGALQPWLGLWPTTFLFAVLHIGPDRRFLVWTVSAFAGGWVLGWMALETGGLLAPIVAHVSINYIGLLWLGRNGSGRHGSVVGSDEAFV